MKIARLIAQSVVLTWLPFAAFAQGKPAPKDAVLYFVWPQDGATIKGGFWCRFGLRGMGVTHAGDNFQNSGHHHLLIDTDDSVLEIGFRVGFGNYSNFNRQFKRIKGFGPRTLRRQFFPPSSENLNSRPA